MLRRARLSATNTPQFIHFIFFHIIIKPKNKSISGKQPLARATHASDNSVLPISAIMIR